MRTSRARLAVALIVACGELVELVCSYRECFPESRLGRPAIVERDARGVSVLEDGSIDRWATVRRLRFDAAAPRGRVDSIMAVPPGGWISELRGLGDGRVAVSRETPVRVFEVVDERGVTRDRWEHPAEGRAHEVLRMVGDVDGDGRRDLLVAWRALGPVRVCSRARVIPPSHPSGVAVVSSGTGLVLWEREWRAMTGPVADVDGDVAFVVGGAPVGVVRPAPVTLWVISATDGQVLRAVPVERTIASATALAAVGDATGDGVADVVLARLDRGDRDGAVFLVDGATGVLVAERRGARNSSLGWHLRGIGDLDGDGVGDVCAAAPGQFPRNDVHGSVVLLSGRDLSLLDELASPTSRAGDAFGADVDVLVESARTTLAVREAGWPTAIHVFDLARR